MRSLWLMLIWTSLCVAGGLTARDADAQGRSDRDARHRTMNDSPKVRVSLDQAADMVRRRTKGTVIGAKTRRSGSSIKHHIKVMKDGNVRTYVVDAVTGAMR